VLDHKSALRVFLLSSALVWGVTLNAANTPKGTVIARVQVEGNQRISSESIFYHAGLKSGDPLTQDQLNRALKALFETNLFADVSIDNVGNTVKIHVLENPIVNRVIFEGNRRINEDSLKSEIFLKFK
jgi:outer membrane protein insertion porin family